MAATRRALLVLAAAAAGAAATRPAWATAPVSARLQQGGFLMGRTAPRAEIRLDGEIVGQAGADGLYLVGFDRDEKSQAMLAVGAGPDRTLAIAPGDFDIQRIDGLPQDQVAPSDPALLARIKAEAVLKARAFASREDATDFRDGFVLPVQGARVSARWGGQRVLNGVPEHPHYGMDLAAPTGTPIHAPAPGLVVLAEPRLHYDGGLTLIDHGQGLISCYLHQSRQLVHAGQRVARGQPIGEIGMTGRATGPHLCWRLKWRTRNVDPSLLIGAAAPA